jgi:hypothetical protein
LRVTASPPSAKGWTARGPHNVCGQGAESFSVKSLRETVAASIDGVTRFSAKVDGEPVEEICRVRSKVYAVALPEKNAFDKLGASPCPAGIYAPTVDEGYYVRLEPLAVGQHRVRIRALNSDFFSGFEVDVTYEFTVVAVDNE